MSIKLPKLVAIDHDDYHGEGCVADRRQKVQPCCLEIGS